MKTNSASIERQIFTLIAAKLKAHENAVKPDARLVDDLGMDSLNALELVMAFEQEFDIDIPDEEAEQLQTVQHVVSYVTVALRRHEDVKNYARDRRQVV